MKNSSALNILKASHRSIKPMMFMWFVCIVFLATTSGVRAALNDIAPLAERSGFVRFGLAESRKVDGHELVDFLYVLEDKKGLLSLDQVSAKASASSDSLGDRLGAWSKVKHNPSNFGYSSSVYWFYLPTSNLSAGDSDWVLEVAYSVLDFVDFYIVRDGRVIGAYKLGDKQPFSNRVFEHRNFRVPMHLEPGEEADIYIRVSTSSAVQVPVNLWEYGGLMKYDQIDTLIIGLYFGLLMVMALYNGMIYLKVRQRSNLHYVLYVISYSFFQASLMGLSYQYLWPSGIHWNDQSILVSLAFTLVFAAMFIRSYLDLKAHSPKLDLIYRYGAWLGGLFIALSFVLPYALMIRIMVIANTIICLFAMVGGIYLWRSIGRSIQYFTLAWIFLFAGGFILAMNKFGVLPRNFFTENASLYGSAMQVILLSMALVEQLHVERRKRFAAQQRAIVQERLAREAQEHALTLQRQDNERLELRVHERTAELEALNNKLKELTIKDSLTGLFNRRYLDTKAEEEYKRAQRGRDSMAILVIDLDHFKQINDQYGHQFGDECLVAVAKALKDNVQRTSDTIARYGGEEFVAILPGASREKARYLAEMIRLSVMSLELMFESRRVSLSASIGLVSAIPKEAGDYEGLLKQADDALYQAKEEGRNRVVCVGGDEPAV